MSSGSISFVNLTFWIIPVAILLALIVYLSFRGIKPNLDKTVRRIILSIRLAVFVLLILLFSQPLIRWTSEKERPPLVLVFVDNSRSMTAQSGMTADSLQKLVSVVESLGSGRGIEYRYILFDSEFEIQERKPTELACDGISTDIINAFRQAARRFQGENIRAGVLISDGNVTAGEEPLYARLMLDFPVYTIGIGDSGAVIDPAVVGLELPESAQVGDTLQIRTRILPAGTGDFISVRLREGKRVLAEKRVATQPNPLPREISFAVIESSPGFKEYTIEVDSTNDTNPYNNKRAGVVRVRKSGVNVVLIQSRIGPEGRFLGRSIQAMEDVSFRRLLERDNRWIYRSQETVFDADWDIVVLMDFPLANTGLDRQNQVRDKLERDHPSLLIYHTPSMDVERLHRLVGRQLIRNRQVRSSVQVITVTLSGEGSSHPLMRSVGDREVWEKMPPIGWPFGEIEYRSEFIPLVTARSLAEEPIVSVANSRSRRTVCFSGYDFWRWHLMTQEQEERSVYDELMQGIVSWLGDTLSSAALQFNLNKTVFMTGEKLEIAGSVFDVRGRLIKNAHVEGRLQQADEDIQKFPIQWDGARYRGQINLRDEGYFQLEITAYLDDLPLDTLSNRLHVIDIPLELVNIYQNAQALRTIAHRTGGEKVTPDNMGIIFNRENYEPVRYREERELRLWRWPGIFILLILLLTGEWILRRIRGYH